ncbi:hypothetical protein MIND_00892900 [Mycena indigotica]|uniref:DUF1793-domain-containing protein n=1 Tax=Mycena indigotica TaxID=2126181 RepID=A0A8H6W1E5_9AGAR|nr:uncharacterized protein MIND_00892900 [Mycena indigotica]KAF7299431.1 hypothetical protein MIND_00892900 [Mycena indigotica]
MRLTQLVATILSAATLAASVDWKATPFNPSAIPLAVRSPYLNTWLAQGGNGRALSSTWPSFWTGQACPRLAKIDGINYSWLGTPAVDGVTYTRATQKSVTITATQSIFVLSAGPVDLTVTFLSPVEPNDLVKQSFPFSYVSVVAASTDGASHKVSIYCDISGEWNSGANTWTINWETTKGDILTHRVQTAAQAQYEEINDVTQYGSIYWSTVNSAGTTTQTGPDRQVREEFLKNGKLTNALDKTFRQIYNSWPVFAHAHDLGSVSSTATKPKLFTIGHVRNPSIQYIVAGGSYQDRSPYFFTKFPTVAAALTSFVNDFSAALTRANAFDAKVQADASKISADYAGVVALSIRQALATIEITTSKTAFGTYDPNDVIVFMKEISSNGNMNTVDVIFPAWPVLLYVNPALGKYLLEGVLRYQATGQYPNKWSIHDIGGNFPKAIGHNDGGDEAMPVEESGNMIIMALSYAQKTGDLSHIKKYVPLFDQFAQFLVSDSLIPANQISTDDFAGPLANQTNLAIKGIIGIGAMGEIHKLLKNNAQSANYSSIAASYVPQWQKLATAASGDHLTLAYGQDNTWGLTYNLFADKLLKLNLFPQSVYDMQTAWYTSHTNAFGVQLDTRHTYTKTDWEIWTATWVTSTALRDTLIGAVKSFVSDGKFDGPFSDWYDTVSGNQVGFRARPVVGGHLAFLIM